VIRLGNSRQHFLHLADGAVPDQGAGFPEFGTGTLLGAGLNNPLVLPGGVDHAAAFHDGQRQRLLAVDVLPRLTGVNGHQGVPMVRDGDDDPIEILALQQFPIVPITFGLTLLVGNDLVSFDQYVAVHIAQSGDIATCGQEPIEVSFPLIPQSDAADGHPLISPETGAGNDPRGPDRQGGRFQKISTVDLSHRGTFDVRSGDL